jgi:ABC-type oligopeptide transport system ATPase subunit
MPPLIELIDVARHYRMGDQQIAALDGVSFAVDRGEMVAIVGSSGSGKSTLLNVLGCLDTPTRGRYRLDGRDVQDLADDERARLRNRQIGFVFRGARGPLARRDRGEPGSHPARGRADRALHRGPAPCPVRRGLTRRAIAAAGTGR